MDLSQRQCDFCHALALLLIKARELGFMAKIQELNRTIEQQRQYIAEGVSKTMDSRHLDKLAADVILFKDGKIVPDESYRPLGVFWESLGGRWGGRFGLESEPKAVQDAKLGWDCDHFEMRKQ